MCLPYAICTCSVTFSHHVSPGKLAQEKHVIIFCCRSLFIDRMAVALFLSLWISVGCFDGCSLLPSVWFWLQWQSVPIASHQRVGRSRQQIAPLSYWGASVLPRPRYQSTIGCLCAVTRLSLCAATLSVTFCCQLYLPYIAWVSWICQALFLRQVFLLAHAGRLQINFKATGWVPTLELISYFCQLYVKLCASCILILVDSLSLERVRICGTLLVTNIVSEMVCVPGSHWGNCS